MYPIISTGVLLRILDGIIVGGSSLKHITDNLDALEDGPLNPSKKLYWNFMNILHHFFYFTDVVNAFDQAWQFDKANCATYYR